MKKNLYLSLVLLLTIVTYSAAEGTQASYYFVEAKQLLQIKKMLKGKTEAEITKELSSLFPVQTEASAASQVVSSKTGKPSNNDRSVKPKPASSFNDNVSQSAAENRNNRHSDNQKPKPTLRGNAPKVTGSKENTGNDQPDPATTAEILDEIKIIAHILAMSDDDIKKGYSDIPQHFQHLDDILSAFKKSKIAKAYGQSTLGTGGVDFSAIESQIIYGVTDFTIKRAKEELMEAHLNYFYQKLNNDDVIPTLIPNSLKVYKSFLDDQSLSLSKYGDAWKAAFEEDMHNLPVAMQDEDLVGRIIDKTKWKDESAKAVFKKQFAPIVSATDAMVYNIHLKKNPVSVIYDLSQKYNSQTETDKAYIKRIFLTADILLKLTGELKQNVYYPADIAVIQDLSSEEWDLLFKMFYLRNKDKLQKILGDNRTLADFYDKLNPTTGKEGLKQIIYQMINNTTAIGEMLAAHLDAHGDKQQKSMTPEDVKRLMELSLNLCDGTSMLIADVAASGSTLETAAKKYQTYAAPAIRSAIEVGEGLMSKQYGKVLDGTTQILTQIGQVIEVNKADKEITYTSNTVKVITKYGSFMLNILSAKDSKAVADALDEMIPHGQYKLKMSSPVSLSLSLYPGAFAGFEYVKNEHGKLKPSANASFFLPVGIDFNFGIPGISKKYKGIARSSFNVFIQALDFGAVLNYRLTNTDSVKTDPVLGFQQLLSPGITLMFHMPKSPVVLGLGANYTPQLRKVGDSSKQGAFRFGLLLGVDVTAIHIGITKHFYALEK